VPSLPVTHHCERLAQGEWRQDRYEHTQTITGLASNGDPEPGAVHVVFICYYEIAKRVLPDIDL
jgi:hypothetical protein